MDLSHSQTSRRGKNYPLWRKKLRRKQSSRINRMSELSWKNHLSLDLPIKLDQAIRARRKRFFNAEKQSTKKKSIDLEYGVWLRLSKYSRKMKMTLSETITYMIDERESKALYESQMTAMKAGLKNLLNK